MASRRRTTRAIRRVNRNTFTGSQVASLLVLIVLVGSAGLVALNWEVQPSGLFTASAVRTTMSAGCVRCLNDFTGFSCTDLAPSADNYNVLQSACETAYTSCAGVSVCPLLSCGNGVCNAEEAENAQNCVTDCA